MIKVQIEKNYKPHQVEEKWYKVWEEKKCFSASVDYDKKPFCIVIPPPNITGSLHMGHALNNTLQDILIRTKRMQGYASLWIPGTDHAGIATQWVVEKELLKEGTDRWTLGREKFLKRVWQWKEKYGSTIVEQLKRMGCSCDWDRERFTMDEGCTKAVRKAFVELYKKGWIYRGKRIVNWCPHCHTALSDLEVEHKPVDGKLYYIHYPLEGGGRGVTIATTRPETILADTAVAVNPKDSRYKDLVGKNVILPLVGRKLPVISDSYVDIEFGTGALKITPAHDANDYEVGKRHNLPAIVVIDDKGYMNQEAGKYAGMDRFECRKRIVEDLKNAGYLEKVEDYEVAVGVCYRCKSVLEPYISEQWFLNTSYMAKPAIEAVEKGKTKFYPERFGKMYLRWMYQLKDWCISRQLWWGHRIPVWKCKDCGYEDAFMEDPNKCPKCGSESFYQDESVLDTWFSSGLWPLSTLGWPEDTPELNYFYPTSVLSTARDIIYLWVARMMMFGLEFKGDIPFYDVLIHATLLKDKKRMSKSLGTGVDPLELFDKYGTCATRFGLALMTEQGQDINFSERRMEMSRNFVNKIWNAHRYVLGMLDKSYLHIGPSSFEFKMWDVWILSKVSRLIKDVTKNIDEYRFDEMAKNLYDFFWDDFCDWYIEITKPILYGDNEKDKERTLWVLEYVIVNFLKLAHPVMPFVTEEIWSYLPYKKGDDDLLIKAPWPKAREEFIDEEAEEKFSLIIDVVRAMRNLRAEVKLPPKRKASFYIKVLEEETESKIKEGLYVINHLAVVDKIDISIKKKDEKEPSKSLSARVEDIDIYMPVEGLIDIDAEIKRLNKEKDKLLKMIASLKKKCENPNFLAKAKPEIVEREKARLLENEDKLSRIEKRLASLT